MKKLPAGTLLLTIVMALVISIFCSSLILAGNITNHNRRKIDLDRKLLRNEESAINLVLADTLFYQSKKESLDLFQSGKDSLTLSRGAWGIFRYAAINCFQKDLYRKKSFLYGAALPDYMNACLYLADHKRSLTLIGNTSLTGNAYLSRSGLNAGYIGQRGYKNNNLIDGEIKESNDSLPPLDNYCLKYLYELAKAVKDSGLLKSNFNLDSSDSHWQSFFDDPSVYYSPAKVSLKSTQLDGHIMICSGEQIEVDESCRFKNILLVAPSIRFKAKCEGIVQAIATDSLVIEDSCIFNYPSALVLLKDSGSHQQNILHVFKNCRINGFILARTENKDPFKSFIEIDENGTISGVVYTMGYLSLKSRVNGIVLTDYFIYRDPSATYENHLVDIVINRNSLSHYFVGTGVFSHSSFQKITTWLY